MKVLVITSDHIVKPDRMHREIVRMGEEAAKYGIMWLPNKCNGRVVEFDAICAGQDYVGLTSNPAEAEELYKRALHDFKIREGRGV